MKKGFTLIELLVVVLIIGILSAVALSQYTIATEKARAAEAWQTLSSIVTAIELYKLANGGDMTAFTNSTDKWSLLDISLPLADSQHTNAKKFGMKEGAHFTYSLESPNYVRAYRGKAKGISWSSDHYYHLFIDLNGEQWNFSKAGFRMCGQISARGKKVCKSMGKQAYSGSDKYILP